MDSVPELLSFAAQVFEKHGGIAERDDHHVMALLPPGLQRSLDLPEEVQLGDGATPLLYGSPVLDRLIQVAKEEIPLVFGRIEVPYMKKAGFDQLLGQDIVFVNGQARVTSRAEARASYMVLILWCASITMKPREPSISVKKIPGSGCYVLPALRNSETCDTAENVIFMPSTQ